MYPKKIHFVRLSVFLNLNQCWLKNVLNPSVISSALCSPLLSINTSGNLLMCDCFAQIIFKHFPYFYIIFMSIYQIRIVLMVAFFILMLTYSYTFCTLIHLGESYFSEMQYKVVFSFYNYF